MPALAPPELSIGAVIRMDGIASPVRKPFETFQLASLGEAPWMCFNMVRTDGAKPATAHGENWSSMLQI